MSAYAGENELSFSEVVRRGAMALLFGQFLDDFARYQAERASRQP